MLLKQSGLSEIVHCFLIKQVIGDCLVLLKQNSLSETVHCFLIKQFIGDCPLFLNKIVYRRLSTVF